MVMMVIVMPNAAADGADGDAHAAGDGDVASLVNILFGWSIRMEGTHVVQWRTDSAEADCVM